MRALSLVAPVGKYYYTWVKVDSTKLLITLSSRGTVYLFLDVGSTTWYKQHTGKEDILLSNHNKFK
jgi:hypothetical protein